MTSLPEVTEATTAPSAPAAARATARRLDGYHVLAYVSVVLLLISLGVALGALFYEAEYGSHAGLTGWELWFAITVDGLGLVLASVLAVQVMLGYRLFDVSTHDLRRVHVVLAWAVVVLVLAHGGGAVAHTFQGRIEPLPVWLDIMGVAIAVLLAAQMAAGYLRSRDKRMRLVHDWLAVAFVLFVALHGFIGYYHVLTG
jgi:cytochrome b561